MIHRRLRVLALATVVAGSAACLRPGAAPPQVAPQPPAAAPTPAADRADPSTREGRAQVLDAVVEVLQENLALPAAGQAPPLQRLRERREELLEAADAATFYAALSELLAAAGTRHLYLYRPGRDLFDRPREETRLVGATLTDINGYSFVGDVWEGGPAHEAGLLYGDELLPMQGQAPALDPLPAGVESVTLWVRRTREGEPFYLTIPTLEGDTLWYLAESTRASIRTVQMGACRVGIIHLRTFADEDLVEEIITGAHFDEADGIILDLRGNQGGEIRLAGEVFDLLTREPSVWIHYRQRAYPFPATSWNRPLLVLVDGTTGSAAEIFAAAVRARGLGTLIGATTAGQVQGSRLFPLPDGSRLLVPVTTVTLPGGAPLEGNGVRPDKPVPRPLMYAQGDDPPMARAVQILTAELACPEPLPPERFPHQDLGPPEGGGPAGEPVP